jgi:P-type E1-E2 ATPase
LEQFGSIKSFAFDKTGTLTSGELVVTDVLPFSGTVHELLITALTVERHSNHPLAVSVVRYAETAGAVPREDQDAFMIPGKGVVSSVVGGATYWVGNRALLEERTVTLTGAQEDAVIALETAGKTPLIIGANQTVIGVIGLADTLRTSAPLLLSQLRTYGVDEFHMLTGDTPRVAAAIGEQAGLGPEAVHGALLPEDKVAYIKKLQAHRPVAFIGDGVNDAAALATAEVGVAMGVAGSDVALEAADVALLSDNLENLGYAYRLSNQANRIIKQNLIFAVGIMLVMVVITTFWYLPLPLGVLGHEGGTLLVVANSLRLLFMKIS